MSGLHSEFVILCPAIALSHTNKTHTNKCAQNLQQLQYCTYVDLWLILEKFKPILKTHLLNNDYHLYILLGHYIHIFWGSVYSIFKRTPASKGTLLNIH